MTILIRVIKNGMLIGHLESYARNFLSNKPRPDYNAYCKLVGISNSGFIDPKIYREWRSYYPEVFISGEKFVPFKCKTYKIEVAERLTKKFLNSIVNFKSNSRYGIRKSEVIDLIYTRLIGGVNSFPSLQNGIDFERHWIRFSSGSYTERGSLSPNSSVYLHKRKNILIIKKENNIMIGYIFING